MTARTFVELERETARQQLAHDIEQLRKERTQYESWDLREPRPQRDGGAR